MTYCLGIKVQEGLVCLADGRITSGSQVSNARKLSLHGTQTHRFTIMTSGLRSLRDKTLAYLDRDLRAEHGKAAGSLLEAVDRYGKCLRQVEEEDRTALEKSELNFNLHSIIAGQLPEDKEPTLYLVYPEGNWIEVDSRTPYLSIGSTAYGKPILDRALTSDTEMQNALKLAYLSFDSTRYSSADVGFPVDICAYLKATGDWRMGQYDYDDLMEQRVWWNEHLTELAKRMPDGPWVGDLLSGAKPALPLSLVRED